MASRRRTWPCYLPLATVLLSVILFYLVAPRFYSKASWKIEEEPNGQTPLKNDQQKTNVPTDQASDDLTIHLHPKEHETRPPKKIHIDWKVTKGERRPDGVAKQVYLINNQFPGPLLEARSGDELIVTVDNALEVYEGLAIHWHGVQVSNEYDGAAGLTQCNIGHGRRFTYHIKIPEHQSGTFWYHSHIDTQRADGLYGPLIVHKPFASSSSEGEIYDYADDQVLMGGDWYHRSAEDVLSQYDNWKSYKIEPAPDSMLLNGKGFFDCSMAVPARPVDCKKVKLPHLKLASGRSRVRVVNTGSLTGFSLLLVGHTLELIKSDGGNDLRSKAGADEVGVLYPGERIDLIIDRNDSSGRSGRITVALDQENIRYANSALRPTQQFPIKRSIEGQDSFAPSSNSNTRDWDIAINLAKVKGQDVAPNPLPQHADKMFVLYATMSYLAINDNRPKGYINHTTWSVSERYTPLLALDRVRWASDPAPFVPKTDGAEWIDIVLNNMDDKGHPFHLHGHNFYVLESHAPRRVGAYDLYNPFDAKPPAGGPMNLVNPPKKDTVYVPSMGYVVLRFKADNPGLWLLHCHILWHQSVGMGMAFEVGGSSDIWASLRQNAKDSCKG